MGTIDIRNRTFTMILYVPGGIRTHTATGSKGLPLPIGLQGRMKLGGRCPPQVTGTTDETLSRGARR